MTPQKPGHYAARWLRAAPATRDAAELALPAVTWTVVEVFENSSRKDDQERLLVAVPGIEASQPLDNFKWGAEVCVGTDPDTTLNDRLDIVIDKAAEVARTARKCKNFANSGYEPGGRMNYVHLAVAVGNLLVAVDQLPAGFK
jgi:hypothetical protein